MNELLIPGTGELITFPSNTMLDAPSEALIVFLYEAKQAKYAINDQLQTPVSDELVRRMDHARKWDLKAPGGYEAKTPRPTALQLRWERSESVKALVELLEELVMEGAITQDAADAAVEHTYKVRAAGIKALIDGGGDVADRIKACGTQIGRRVTVTRKLS